MTYRLQDRSRLGRIGLAVATVLIASIRVHASMPLEASTAAETWRAWGDDLWDAAIDGQDAKLRQMLEAPPRALNLRNSGSIYDTYVSRWQKTESRSAEDLAEAKAEALHSLGEALDADQLGEALRYVLAYQELTRDFDSSLDHVLVRAAIDRANAAIPDLLEAANLMEAQEILYRLRTTFQDTGDLTAYEQYDRQLEDVTDQLQLIRRYHPRHFHELYRQRALSKGDAVEDLRGFNPLLETRWKQEVGGVHPGILRNVLETAAREHIDSAGWRPLLQGGIDALQGLSETSAIEPIFPGLAEDDRRDRWREGLFRIEAALADGFDTPGRPQQIGGAVIEDIAELNAETVRLPSEVLWREFGDGAMGDLDRFSEVIWPHDLEYFNRQMQGEFIGVGVYIEETELGEIRIVSPLEGKPAGLAGIRAGDVVVEVDGVSTAGWSLRDAVREITGPAQTMVTLGIRREGEAELSEFTITRDRIRMHTVKGWEVESFDEQGNPQWNWFIDERNRIGYIRMTGFDQQTYADLLQAIGGMQRSQGMPSGLILDLRHNPGGLLETAVNVSNLFLPSGPIVSGEDRQGAVSFRASARPRKAYLAGLPLVILINNGSASASEIVAGCLQAHEAAVVVGSRSFGKGSVQTVHSVSDQAKLKLTTQYYRLPSVDGIAPGRMVHKIPGESDWGVVPDITVEMTPEQIVDSITVQREAELRQPPADWNIDEDGPWTAPRISQLLEDGLDPQLHTALMLLQARIFSAQSAIADSR